MYDDRIDKMVQENPSLKWVKNIANSDVNMLEKLIEVNNNIINLTNGEEK